ncbi:MAG: YeaH/YhbH family protein [Sphingomonadales bacterium]
MTMETIIRPYSPSESLGSDRSSGDRLRHRQKVRKAIRENIADLVSEQSIIGQSRDKIIKIPIRGIKEYRFVYGDNTPRAGQGEGNTKAGDVIADQSKDGSDRGPGNRPGVDYYETDITLEELIDLMFEDLALPDLERKALREVVSERTIRPKGYRRVGIRAQLSKRRTAKTRIRRLMAGRRGALRSSTDSAGDEGGAEGQRFPFYKEDLRYHRRKPDIRRESNAAVFCIMDTSGSMDNLKKYLARSFFFLLYQFVRTQYQAVEVVFVAHDAEARRVDEEEFFHKGSSGGTMISSGYQAAIDIIKEFYDPAVWNLYAFHCSDGDNFPHDNPQTVKTAKKLCRLCNLFGYGEIKPTRSHWDNSSMLDVFSGLKAKNFAAVKIESKEDVWPTFRSFLSKERTD